MRKKFSAAEVRKLKSTSGGNIWVGGPNLTESFIKAGLVDEFRFIINPVILGNGITPFKTLSRKLNLTLVSSRKFKSGNVFLVYKPAVT